MKEHTSLTRQYLIRITSKERRAEVFHLRYRAYRHFQLIPQSQSMRFEDSWDESPFHILWGIVENGNLVASIRTTWTQNIPELTAYGDFLRPISQEDWVSGNRLVVCPTRKNTSHALIIKLLRIHLLAACGVARYAVCAVRNKHVNFYRRLLHMDPVGSPKLYPGLSCSMTALWCDCKERITGVYHHHPALQSREGDQSLLDTTLKTTWEQGVPLD